MNTIKLREVNALGATPKEFEASFNFKPLIDFDHPDNVSSIYDEGNFEMIEKVGEGLYYCEIRNRDNNLIYSTIFDIRKKPEENKHIYSMCSADSKSDFVISLDYFNSNDSEYFIYTRAYVYSDGENIFSVVDCFHDSETKLYMYKLNLDAKTPEVTEVPTTQSKVYSHQFSFNVGGENVVLEIISTKDSELSVEDIYNRLKKIKVISTFSQSLYEPCLLRFEPDGGEILCCINSLNQTQTYSEEYLKNCTISSYTIEEI